MDEQKQKLSLNYLLWDDETVEAFITCYNNNLNQEVFTFDENEYLTAYAKYLIEYLESL